MPLRENRDKNENELQKLQAEIASERKKMDDLNVVIGKFEKRIRNNKVSIMHLYYLDKIRAETIN